MLVENDGAMCFPFTPSYQSFLSEGNVAKVRIFRCLNNLGDVKGGSDENDD